MTIRPVAGMFIAASMLSCFGCGRGVGTAPVSADTHVPVNFHPTLSKEEKQHVLDGPCSVVTSTASMPTALKAEFAGVTKETQFELADPGVRWQATDVIVTRGLPRRRLILAGSCGDRWFVHYERGGLATSVEVVIFRTDAKGGVQFEWGGVGYRAKGVDDLRAAIAAGKFDDDRTYYW
jgi:hypothetical protein